MFWLQRMWPQGDWMSLMLMSLSIMMFRKTLMIIFTESDEQQGLARQVLLLHWFQGMRFQGSIILKMTRELE